MPGISAEIWRLLAPPAEVSSWDWLCQYGRAHDGSRFDPDHVPWCRGVCQVFDDPHYTEIALQWAARMFKTSLCHLLLLYQAAVAPCAMLLGTPTEKLARQHVRWRLYGAAERMAPLQHLLPPEKRRGQLSVEFSGAAACRIQAAWAGSETMMADRSARITHAAEVDKWEQPSADTGGGGEGDVLEQFEKRSHEYPDRKNLTESTPQQRGRSRIEARRLQGTDCRLFVPCPHCGAWDYLRRGNGDRRGGGVIWRKEEAGKHDPDLAYATAVYVCSKCADRSWGGEIIDAQKPAMVRAGVWVPAGCRIDEKGVTAGETPPIAGTPHRPQTRIWSSQLSALYSLDVRWGQIAEWWVRSYRHPGRRRTFVQLTDGETYEVLGKNMTTDERSLAQRLCTQDRRGRLPRFTRLVILACDVQKETLPWLVLAIGDNLRTHVVDWGRATEWGQLENLLSRAWPLEEDGKEQKTLRVQIALLDSGYRTKQVYDFQKAMRRRRTRDRLTPIVLACKGTSQGLAGDAWKISRLGIDTRARRKASKLSVGTRLVRVQVEHWEELVQSALCEDLLGKPGHLTLCAEAAGDEDFLADLLNATFDDDLARWVKRNIEHTNDFRDDLKYGFCAADVWIAKHFGRLPGDKREGGLDKTKPRPKSRPPWIGPQSTGGGGAGGPFSIRPRGWLG